MIVSDEVTETAGTNWSLASWLSEAENGRDRCFESVKTDGRTRGNYVHRVDESAVMGCSKNQQDGFLSTPTSEENPR